MKLLFINELINSDLAAAIAWTLLHSVWQGMLAAILAGVIILFFKKQSSSVRYYLFSLVFFLFPLAVSVTFIIQFNQINPANSNVVYQAGEKVSSVTTKNTASVILLPGMNTLNRIITRADVLLHQYYPFLFSGWLLVFVFKLCFMLTGFRWMSRLRREGM